MNVKLLLSVFFAVVISGCQTMHFDRGENVTSTTATSSWHHNFVLGLYEGSAPVMLSNKCADGTWTSVTTKTSFINAVVTNVVSNAVAPIWQPETVEVKCK
ncbi:hypothetical protein [uncultured Psychrosphaera sp.]|jgi:hypothetical protein|uniref:Bor/Iss family lipoprotein n=1 Tax=uncultured Psychrosphaera sp. TaxID=1403522 RepID=UPI0026258615|nr:hypothetical protein [uncultured Psychrosphaera sp.]